jgi:outer membrane protein assembly factor BamD (BamD/ComL family)
MQTDYDLLGIAETKDASEIKSAYRKIVKEVHPDVATRGDPFKNHLRFIQIPKAYERLMTSLSKARKKPVEPTRRQTSKESGLVRHKDPAYAYYKTAMNYFRKIHPSSWRVDVSRALTKPSPIREEELAAIQDKTRALLGLLPRAYYYFSIVVHEYPDSVWTEDARDKMNQIEDRTAMYERIVMSFTEHAKRVPRVNRMF